MVQRSIDCALVFANGQPDWSHWERPWYVGGGPGADYDWGKWATAPGTKRQLILTQNLIPISAQSEDWRHLGAAGAYVQHARVLARNLVAAGLGNSIIRLSHEANGDWNPDSIGNTDAQYGLWAQFWRETVLAMRSVPGADFRFDWCINGRYRPIALDKWYPGDDVVDIIGIDAYDSGVPSGQPRWATIYDRPLGIHDVERFAAAHRKPLSIPEWGVAPIGFQLSGGDDAAYVDGIASVVRNNNVAYQSYFSNHQWATQLATGPSSLAAYVRHFGNKGDSTDIAPVATPPTPGSPATPGSPPAPESAATPASTAVRGTAPTGSTLRATDGRASARLMLRITGATIGVARATFHFAAQRGTKLSCRLNSESWRQCSTRTRDRVRLLKARNVWHVWARNDAGNTIARNERSEEGRASRR
jgi:hypothetical protein